MMSLLTVERVDDTEVIDHLFLLELMRKYLTDREHAVLALRACHYTRTHIVNLLGIGKTTVYTCERRAIKKLRSAYLLEQQREEKITVCTKTQDTRALPAEDLSHGSLPSVQSVNLSTEEPRKNGPTG